MLKPVVSTLTAHAMMAPAAIRMRLTPRPMCSSSWGFVFGVACGSRAAGDSDELEVCADLTEQLVQAGHERRVPPFTSRRRRAEAERADDQRLTDLFEFVHALGYSPAP